jgi:hypothetical protein
MKKTNFKLKNNKWSFGDRGQGIVSVLVAIGVGTVALGFITDMLIQQGVGQKYLTQKFEINDLTNNIISTFSKASNCTCQFADSAAVNPNFGNFTNLKFNSTIVDGSQKIDVRKIYTGCLGGPNPPLVIAEQGVDLPNSSGIRVNKVELVNLRPTGAANEWQGQWQVSFQTGSGSIVRSTKPTSITQKITINTAAPYSATAAVISACGGVDSGMPETPIGSIIAWHKSFPNTPGLPVGWVECNGQVISDAASVYNGQTVPNLNSDTQDGSVASGMFLRGASTSGTLQDDATALNGLSVTSRTNDGSTVGGGGSGAVGNNTPGNVNLLSSDTETRPANMTVVWIMKIR